MGEDMDLLFRVREAGLEVATLDEQVYQRRIHGRNMTSDGDLRRLAIMRAFKARIDRRRAAGAA